MPLSKEIADALRAIRIPTNALRQRAAELFENPDQLNQDAFGICGMSAVIYVLLKTNPTGALELLGQLFGRGRTDLATMTDGDPSAQNQLMRYYTRTKPLNANYQLDFIFPRYLGVLMERKEQELYAAQERFTGSLATALGGGGADPLDMTKGNLAIDFDGMKWMVDSYLWAGRSKQLKVSRAWPGGGPAADLAVITQATRDHYVISAQDIQGLTPPMFSHWVVLLGVTKHDGGRWGADVRWQPNEFSRGHIVDYNQIELPEDDFRTFYPRIIMADT